MKNKYRIVDDVVYIELNRRKGPNLEAIIDLNDFDIVNMLDGTWCASEDKRCNITYCVMGYKNENEVRTTFKLHNFLTQSPKKMQVDHLNHNGLDNRRNNLRVATDGENKQNWIDPKSNKEDRDLPVGVTYEKQKTVGLFVYIKTMRLYISTLLDQENLL